MRRKHHDKKTEDAFALFKEGSFLGAILITSYYWKAMHTFFVKYSKTKVAAITITLLVFNKVRARSKSFNTLKDLKVYLASECRDYVLNMIKNAEEKGNVPDSVKTNSQLPRVLAAFWSSRDIRN